MGETFTRTEVKGRELAAVCTVGALMKELHDFTGRAEGVRAPHPTASTPSPRLHSPFP